MILNTGYKQLKLRTVN